MTTKHSSRSALKKQSDEIARVMKAAERGEKLGTQFAEKIEAARNKDSVKFGIVMDDKIITITIPWATIRETGEVALSEYVFKQMREELTQ